MKHAVLGYHTENIGDDMQSLAASRFFPGDVARIDRERLSSLGLLFSRYKLIANGWFMHEPSRWPPVRSIDPLIISFHVAPWAKRMFNPRGLAFFRRQEKRGGVGARDLHSMRLFQDAGVDAYFSGCLTLTLKAPADIVKTDNIYAVDLDPIVEARLRETTRQPIHRLTHEISPGMSQPERLAHVQRIFRTYCGAKAVMTSRIHAAFPCLAVGTPVLLVHDNPGDERFSGNLDHLHFASRDDFLAGRYTFDPADPPPNKNTHLALVPELERRCAAFIAGR